MSYEINVLYPRPRERVPIPMAAQSELTPAKIDLKSLETDLLGLIKMLDKLESEETNYSVDEVKLGVGISEDSEGKIRIGFAASILTFFRGEASGELGQRMSQNQLFEIRIHKK
jgi:hypothetical protein